MGDIKEAKGPSDVKRLTCICASLHVLRRWKGKKRTTDHRRIKTDSSGSIDIRMTSLRRKHTRTSVKRQTQTQAETWIATIDDEHEWAWIRQRLQTLPTSSSSASADPRVLASEFRLVEETTSSSNRPVYTILGTPRPIDPSSASSTRQSTVSDQDAVAARLLKLQAYIRAELRPEYASTWHVVGNGWTQTQVSALRSQVDGSIPSDSIRERHAKQGKGRSSTIQVEVLGAVRSIVSPLLATISLSKDNVDESKRRPNAADDSTAAPNEWSWRMNETYELDGPVSIASAKEAQSYTAKCDEKTSKWKVEVDFCTAMGPLSSTDWVFANGSGVVACLPLRDPGSSQTGPLPVRTEAIQLLNIERTSNGDGEAAFNHDWQRMDNFVLSINYDDAQCMMYLTTSSGTTLCYQVSPPDATLESSSSGSVTGAGSMFRYQGKVKGADIDPELGEYSSVIWDPARRYLWFLYQDFNRDQDNEYDSTVCFAYDVDAKRRYPESHLPVNSRWIHVYGETGGRLSLDPVTGQVYCMIPYVNELHVYAVPLPKGARGAKSRARKTDEVHMPEWGERSDPPRLVLRDPIPKRYQAFKKNHNRYRVQTVKTFCVYNSKLYLPSWQTLGRTIQVYSLDPVATSSAASPSKALSRNTLEPITTISALRADNKPFKSTLEFMAYDPYRKAIRCARSLYKKGWWIHWFKPAPPFA